MGELAKMMMGGEASGDYAYYKRDVTINTKDTYQDSDGCSYMRCDHSDNYTVKSDGSLTLLNPSGFTFPNSPSECSGYMNSLIGEYFMLTDSTAVWYGISTGGDPNSADYKLYCKLLDSTLGPKKYYVENENKHSTYVYKDGVMTVPVV